MSRHRLYDTPTEECDSCGETFQTKLARELHYLDEHAN